jgi:hypothetical protein
MLNVRLLTLVELGGELVSRSSFAMPPVAAMLPAVNEASEVVSMFSTSPLAAMSWRSCRR